MIAAARPFVRLSALLRQAPRRSFAGLVLDGFDVVAAIAAEKRGRTLAKAADVARRAGESVWAERFARRGYAIASDAAAALQLASILASFGQCEEAAGLLSTIADRKKGEAYREIRAVLHAKAGEADEAFAMFDTLPRSLDGHRPIVARRACVGLCSLGSRRRPANLERPSNRRALRHRMVAAGGAVRCRA